MDEHRNRILGQGEASPERVLTIRVTTAASGAIIILGAGASYLLTWASPEGLAATSRALLTIALIGLLMTAVVAVHLSLTSRDQRGGHGRSGDGTPEPVPAPTTDDLDAEFFRIIEGERLRGI